MHLCVHFLTNAIAMLLEGEQIVARLKLKSRGLLSSKPSAMIQMYCS